MQRKGSRGTIRARSDKSFCHSEMPSGDQREPAQQVLKPFRLPDLKSKANEGGLVDIHATNAKVARFRPFFLGKEELGLSRRSPFVFRSKCQLVSGLTEQRQRDRRSVLSKLIELLLDLHRRILRSFCTNRRKGPHPF